MTRFALYCKISCVQYCKKCLVLQYLLWIWRLLCFIRFATNWKICIIFKYLLFNRRVSSRFAIHWKNCSVFKICSALCCVLEDFLHLGIFAVYRKICCELEDLPWIGRFGVHWKIWCALKDLLCIERFAVIWQKLQPVIFFCYITYCEAMLHRLQSGSFIKLGNKCNVNFL